MVITYILLVVGFVILLKGADFLVDGASSIALHLDIPNLVIGLTVVAFGTSAPELFVNVYASISGNTDIAIGNVLGSNVANIFLILGSAAIIYPLTIHSNTTWKEIPFSLLGALALGILANDLLIDKEGVSALTRSDGLILLAFFIIFMYYVVEMARKPGRQATEKIEKRPLSRSILLVVIGLAGLVLGGQWIVNGAVAIAAQFDVSQSLLGLTIVAIGTSLPELATSVMAARKKNVDIAVGNVIGSNIFNIFLILGVSSVIKPLPFHPSSRLDILVSILSNLLLFSFVFLGHRLLRWQGLLFVALYVLYLVYLVWRG